MKPSTGPVRAAALKPAANDDGAARRLDVDDLFGMAELTGDAPLSSLDPPAPPPLAVTPADDAPRSGAHELDLEIETKPPAKPAPADTPLPDLDALLPTPKPDGAPLPSAGAQMPLEDSIAVPPVPQASPPQSGLELDDKPAKPPESLPKAEPARRPITKPQAPAKPKEPEIAPARALVSSALTGLLGAALAIIVVIASALSGDAEAGWLGFGPASDVVATGVVSGLYDTAAGKPVFYVRGRVQNRSGRVRGPVRITAALVGSGDEQLRAETIAGTEPTPEDVWSVRSPADAEKLSRALQAERVERKLQPGASLPFFALIPDPPTDLQGRRLEIRVETVDAWTPQGAKAARER